MKSTYTAISLTCSLGLLNAQSDLTEESQTIVTANRYEQSKNDTSSAVSIIDAERFSLLQPQSLDDALRGEPNIEFSGGPRITGEQLEIRGQGGNAVTVRLDGARQNFVSGHAGQRFFIDPLFLNSAEIIRGAKSHLYGSGAAGVVNLSTYKPSDLIDSDKGFGAKIHTGYQGVNDEKSYAGLFALGNDDLRILLGYANRQSNNIELGNGIDSEGSAIDRESFMLKLNYTPVTDHEFSLDYHFYESQDESGANPQADSGISNALVEREISFQQLSLGHHWSPADNDLFDLISTLYFNRTEQTRDYLSTSGSNLDRQNKHTIETFGIDIVNRSSYSAFGAENTLISGIEYFHDKQEGDESRDTFYSGGIAGTSSGRPDAESDNFALYLENWTDFDNGLSISAGLRFDHFSTEGRSVSQSDSQISPHIGLRYEIVEGISIYGDYAHAFTSPTLNQLYQEGSHFGVVPASFFPAITYFEEVFVPNDELESQSSQNYEIGIDFEQDIGDGVFDAKLLAFYQKGKDTYDSEIIDTVTTPGYFGFAGPGTLTQDLRQSVNRNETTIMGFEADINYTADQWYSRLTYAYLDGEDDSTGDNLNTITGNKLFLETGYTPTEDLTLGINALFTGSRDTKVSDDSLKTSSYAIYGLFANWQCTDDLNLTIGVNNLLDNEYERTNINNTEAGRNVYVSASYTF